PLHRSFNAELLPNARGPLRAQQPVRNLLNVRQKIIDRTQLAFAGGKVHLARAADEIVHVCRRFLQELEVRLRTLLADELVGIGLARKSQNANLEDVFQQDGERALGCGLASGDRKSTRLNSSHGSISYAVFCLKKNKHNHANDDL